MMLLMLQLSSFLIADKEMLQVYGFERKETALMAIR
jgi:hypothetical protein